MTSVLVVDDSEPLGRLLKQTLDRAGHDCRWVASGAEALAEAETFQPNVVVVDLHLSDTSGADLNDALRKTLPSARIIGLSGQAPDAAVNARFDAFLVKPVPLSTLVSVLAGE